VPAAPAGVNSVGEAAPAGRPIPTTDARERVLTRYTEPDTDLRRLLAHMKLPLPRRPPPRIRAARHDLAALAV